VVLSIHYSGHKIKKIKGWVGNVESTREIRDAYRVLVNNPNEKRAMESLGYRWNDNIKTNLQQRGWRRALNFWFKIKCGPF
jgi:hypothetical protein